MDVDFLFRRKDPETKHCFVLNPIQRFFTVIQVLWPIQKRKKEKKRDQDLPGRRLSADIAWLQRESLFVTSIKKLLGISSGPEC